MVTNKKSLKFSWLILVFALWILAISHHSFWLDEAHGAGWKSRQTTLAEFWRDDFAQISSTDSQTPLYVFYIWIYAKFFGSSEWVLRAANLPWVFLGFWAWQKALTQNNFLKFSIVAVAASSPFLWYYLNEARPYAMQIGGSFLIAGALGQLSKPLAENQSRFWMTLLGCGAIALSGSNLLGQLWAGAALTTAFFVFGWAKIKTLLQRHWVLCGTTFFALFGLGIYYLWTLQSGARATSVGGTDAKNFGFILFELLGFSGLGPGRLTIRDAGLASFRPYFFGLALYALVLMPILFFGLREIWRIVPRRVIGLTILFFGLVALFLATIGVTSQFRLLGRHFAPLLVLILFWLGAGVSCLWRSESRLKNFVVLAFLALSLASCFALRFASRHAKDDYRGAAEIARMALRDGKNVWWNADQRGAGYYYVETRTNDFSTSAARFFTNPAETELQTALEPNVVICSKPDVYDERAIIFNYLQTRNFRITTNLSAFSIWEKSPR